MKSRENSDIVKSQQVTIPKREVFRVARIVIPGALLNKIEIREWRSKRSG